MLYNLFKNRKHQLNTNISKKYFYVSSKFDYDQLVSYIKNNKDPLFNAIEILNNINKDGMIADLKIYSSLIEKSYRLKHYENIIKIFKDITEELKATIILDIKIYEMILDSYKNIISSDSFKEFKEIGNKDIKSEEIFNFRKLIQNIKLKESNYSPRMYNYLIQIYMLLGEFKSSWDYYCLMKRKSFLLTDQEIIIVLLKGINKHFDKMRLFMGNPTGFLKEIFQLSFSQERVNNNRTNYRTTFIINYIELCDKFNIKELLRDIFEIFINDKEILLPSETILIMIKHFKEEILRIYDVIIERKIECDQNLFLNFLKIFRKMNRVDILEDIIKLINSSSFKFNSDIKFFTHLIKCSNLCENYKDSIKIFNSIPISVLVESKIDIFNIIMKSYIKTKKPDQVLSLFKFLMEQHKNPHPNAVPNIKTYTSIIEAYLMLGDIQEARNKYSYLKNNKPYLISLQFFNTVSEALIKYKRYHAAMEIIYDIHKFNFKPDIKSYYLMMKIFLETLDEDNAILVFDQINRDNLKSDESIYFILMQIFVKKNKIIQALAIYNDMKLNLMNINTEVYNFIFISCLIDNKIEEAVMVLIDTIKERFSFEMKNFKKLIDKLLTIHEISNFNKTKYLKLIQKELKEKGIILDDETNSFTNVLLKIWNKN